MLLWLGTKDSVLPSVPFLIEPDVEHRLVLSAAGGRILLVLDGATVVENESVRFVSSENPMLLGNWVVPGREMRWGLEELRVTLVVPAI